MATLPLFGPPPPPGASRLAARLAELAREGVWIRTNSWKYEGWLGNIYTAERYLARGRFSRRRFEQECLAEYAATFPIVCGDFSFYQFPSEAYWQRLFASAPRALKFGLKAPEQVTCKLFPSQARYGSAAGQENETFLDAALFNEAFARPLERYREQVAVVIFEFGAFSRRGFERLDDFLAALDRFLGLLAGGFRYAVEIRNPELLKPGYFECLKRHGAAHTFNAWTRMPELAAQTALSEAFTAPFSVTRALLRHGRTYEQAVAKFSPYSEVREPNPAAREALRALIQRSRADRREAYIFVNNRLEGNAPATIEAITGE